MARSGSRFTHFSSVNRRSTTWRRTVPSSSSTSSSRDEVAPGMAAVATTREPVVLSIHRRTFSETTSPPPKHNLPERRVGFHQLVRVADLIEGKDTIDNRLQGTQLEKRHAPFRKFSRQRDFLLELTGAQHCPNDG